MVGFSDETIAGLHDATQQMWEQVYAADHDAAYAAIRALMDAEIARHRTYDHDDFLSRLLEEEVDGAPITDDLAARMVMSLAIAGHETTANAASSMMWLLANDLPLQDQLRAEPAQASAFIEELLRLRAPAHNFARTANQDLVVDEVMIPANSRVLLSYASANRDPLRFPNPDSFDVSRASRAHLAFGWGIHQCIGATLVREELRVLLETLCEFPRFVPDGDASFDAMKGGVHFGPSSVPLHFEETQG